MKGLPMHTHVGVLMIGTAFVGTLLVGTLWRLGAAHLAGHPERPAAARWGQAMSIQY